MNKECMTLTVGKESVCLDKNVSITLQKKSTSFVAFVFITPTCCPFVKLHQREISTYMHALSPDTRSAGRTLERRRAHGACVVQSTRIPGPAVLHRQAVRMV